jgi:2-polyprenyl-3-methyl-5-hydroxy-6-metoxy-1,4-benzoquinol methylase
MVKCKICGCRKSRNLFRKASDDFAQCLFCKTVFVSNELTKVDIEQIYSYDYYYKLRRHDPIIEKRYKDLLERFRFYKKNNLLLDIGCGTGQFMKSAQKESWNTLGIEVSKEIAEWAMKEHGLKILVGELPDLKLDAASFDIVTMFEVIEHLRDPLNYLNEIFKILRRDGLLFLTTPNYNSLSRILLGSKWSFIEHKHLFYFTPKTLKSLLRKTGFKKVELITKNISISEIARNMVHFSKNRQKGHGAERLELRDKIESNPLLGLMKKNINFFLNLFGVGDSIWLMAEKARD